MWGHPKSKILQQRRPGRLGRFKSRTQQEEIHAELRDICTNDQASKIASGGDLADSTKKYEEPVVCKGPLPPKPDKNPNVIQIAWRVKKPLLAAGQDSGGMCDEVSDVDYTKMMATAGPTKRHINQ